MSMSFLTAARLGTLLLFSTSASYGYSVLTHEAIVDTLWDASIQKLLVARFPGATAEELERAHAYAYGGCILQDMGYYPFSSRLFSDLTHYVRSGDFIVALIRESQDLNEYAFALGRWPIMPPPPHRDQSRGAHPVPQTSQGVREDCYLLGQSAFTRPNRVRFRCIASGARTIRAGLVSGLHRFSGVEAGAGAGLPGHLRD